MLSLGKTHILNLKDGNAEECQLHRSLLCKCKLNVRVKYLACLDLELPASHGRQTLKYKMSLQFKGLW